VPFTKGVIDAGSRIAARMAAAAAAGLGPTTPLFAVNGSDFMTAARYNALLKQLCLAANTDRVYTARCLRHGRRTDLFAQMLPETYINYVGRWRHTKSSVPYQDTAESVVDIVLGHRNLPANWAKLALALVLIVGAVGPSRCVRRPGDPRDP